MCPNLYVCFEWTASQQFEDILYNALCRNIFLWICPDAVRPRKSSCEGRFGVVKASSLKHGLWHHLKVSSLGISRWKTEHRSCKWCNAVLHQAVRVKTDAVWNLEMRHNTSHATVAAVAVSVSKDQLAPVQVSPRKNWETQTGDMFVPRWDFLPVRNWFSRSVQVSIELFCERFRMPGAPKPTCSQQSAR